MTTAATTATSPTKGTSASVGFFEVMDVLTLPATFCVNEDAASDVSSPRPSSAFLAYLLPTLRPEERQASKPPATTNARLPPSPVIALARSLASGPST